MHKTAFRAYDIRGIVGQNIILEDSYKLGISLIKWLKQNYQNISAVIGRDGRTSSPVLYDNLYTALKDSSIPVYGVGIVTSPQLYFEEQQINNFIPRYALSGTRDAFSSCSLGIMITASHNDGHYNGLKIVKNGVPLNSAEIQDLYSFFISEPNITPTKIHSPQAKPSSYLKHLINIFSDLKDLDLPLFIDTANGPTGQIISNLCALLNFQNVTLVANDLDSNFRCHRPDPTQPYGRVLFTDKPLDALGVAFDGDGDRLVIVDEAGSVIRGDQLLAIFALYSENTKVIVADIKCAFTLTNFLNEKNIKTIWSASGHGHIKQKVHEHSASIGGELSGHYCFMDKPEEIYGFDDALYAFLRLLRITKKFGPIKDLVNELPKFYSTGEQRIHMAENIIAKDIVNKVNKEVISLANNYDTIDGVRAQINDSYITVRSSNTENVISISIDSNSEKELDKTRDILDNLIAKYTQKECL